MFFDYLNLLLEFRWRDFFDIGVTTLVLSLGIHVLRSTRARAVTVGVLFFAAIFFVSRYFELQLTTWLLHGIAAATVVLLIVLFQNEIRHFLEKFPSKFFFRKSQKLVLTEGIPELMAEVVSQLSTKKRGAIILLPGKVPLENYVSGGVLLNGKLSKELLLSLFDPNSPGHDGALIIQGDQITHFGLRLPLSEQHEKLRSRGTRHAAALGLSERTDALVIVVSEETSQITLAHDGEMEVIAEISQLTSRIEQFSHHGSTFNNLKGRPASVFSWHSQNFMIAMLSAVALWLFLVPASVVDDITFNVPISVQNIPDGFYLKSISPPEVEITIAGKRRDLFQITSGELKIQIDGTFTRLGRKTFHITKGHLLLPPEVEILKIVPEDVQVLISSKN